MRREVKIGVFAVVMLGCLWGGIRFLSGIDIFSRNIPYYVAYPEISGIQTATPVTIQGVKVGTVTAIGFDPSVSRDVVLQLTVRRSFRIPRDSKARIYSDGFMGGKATPSRWATARSCCRRATRSWRPRRATCWRRPEPNWPT